VLSLLLVTAQPDRCSEQEVMRHITTIAADSMLGVGLDGPACFTGVELDPDRDLFIWRPESAAR
jgi:hypothetical protein